MGTSGLSLRSKLSAHGDIAAPPNPSCMRSPHIASVVVGYWVSGHLSKGFHGHVCPTKLLPSKARSTPPQLSESLVVTFSQCHRYNKAQHEYIWARHFHSYEDLVAWGADTCRRTSNGCSSPSPSGWQICPLTTRSSVAHHHLRVCLLQ